MTSKHERAERLAADRERRAEQREPRFGVLDEDRRPAGDDYSLWHIAAYLPDGREAEVAEFLAEHGIGVYRMWEVAP